ncbi:MAG: homoserine O-acetyltransferase, partial [Chitinophagaceae bacterium]
IIFANVTNIRLYFAFSNPGLRLMNYFYYKSRFDLEAGGSLEALTVAYSTYGEMNENRDNVVWICHALTANSEVTRWWKGLAGEDSVIDPSKYFIVCANIIGSCYGTTGPLSEDPRTGEIYAHNFPQVTIRDMVKAHILLREHLGIEKIYLLIGGSMGGYQAIEWAIMESAKIGLLVLLATSSTESAWGIAIHTAQRLAIEADASWAGHASAAGSKGLKVARAIGMLSYRNYGILVEKQTDTEIDKLDGYRASSYINYQGDKLVERFNAYSYWLLTRSMDSHHIARFRGVSTETILRGIRQKTLIIGISSDILCPLNEQRFLGAHIPDSQVMEIDSAYGHDGFMVESEKIGHLLARWL